MLVAVTNSDESNMMACQVAYSLFKTPTKIARIRSEQYIIYQKQLFKHQDIPVDHLIAPEQLVTNAIKRLIDYPGALQVVEFADGRASLVAVKAYYGGLLVGHALSALKEHIPNVDTRVAAIYRRGRPIRPLGTTVIEADDEVFFIAATKHIRAVMSELQKLESSYKRIMIAGGGLIGAGLAKQLEHDHHVKLIEFNIQRAKYLSTQLDRTIVFNGDASDQELLMEEHVDQIDAFLAVTNDDEANIMSAMLAKRLGAKKAMVLIQRSAYVDLVQGGKSTLHFHRNRRPFQRFSPISVEEILLTFIPYAEAPQKQSKQLLMVISRRQKWSVEPYLKLNYHPAPQLEPS